MKRLFFTFLLFPFLIYAQPHKKYRVLFLGNSYTYVNNLPLLISSIALANGDSLIYDSNCIGGYSFYDHLNDAASISKIGLGNWDFVVLQAQSQEPSFPPAQVNVQTLPYAIKLDSVVKHYNNCATTVFYETWGRKYGDAGNCASYPPLCTYIGMQDRLKASYKLFTDTVKAVMSPVGEAFRKSIALNPGLELYQSDQSHPSLEGSYIAACTFYETLFQKSVLSTTFNPGIGTTTLTFLQQTAHDVVVDSLWTWNISKYLPFANYTYSLISSSSFQFQSGSLNMSEKWYFGDGSTSLLSNPLHNYLNPGTYPVSRVVIHTCKKDSVVKSLNVSATTGISEIISNDLLRLFPNPCSDFLNIKASPVFETNYSTVEIRNVLGECVYKSFYRNAINIQNLEKGMYFIRISNDLAESNSCFIKNE